ncbi:MAG: hypothetical protein ACREDA_12020 [Methylocella sp.]
MNIFLVPAPPENIRMTLVGQVDFERAAKYLDDETADDLVATLGGRFPFHCFATTEGNRRRYERMHPHDELLFAETGTGHFTWRGQVKTKFENDRLGGDLWPSSGNTGIQKSRGNKPWRLIYVVDEIEKIQLDKHRALQAFGFKTPRDELGGLRRVPDHTTNRLIAAYGTVDGILSAINKGMI